jgi:hypothetical protein
MCKLEYLPHWFLNFLIHLVLSEQVLEADSMQVLRRLLFH